ncbi:MAG TPA: acetate/propionate family kinase [Geminicoccaceae bacterium]|nr:acetate/propionate family kinase [Geminicoccaceae bacterium]
MSVPVPATLLVVNAGSSSIKFQLFDVRPGDRLHLTLKGQMDGIGTQPRLVARGADGTALVNRAYEPMEIGDIAAAFDRLDDWLIAQLGGARPLAIGHRVVHGGPDHAAPVVVDDAILRRLEALVPLAPLHQPNNLAPIRALRAKYPETPQVACFDTAFHRGHPEVADRSAIPGAWYQEGVRRYGFHGLSYEWIAHRLRELDPALAAGRAVVCLLGSGASMCAIEAGRSIDSTMGFTAVDGLPMGTRTGQLDPGVILYLVQAKGFDGEQIERFLYHDGGLKGLSGVSNDMRDLLASDAPGARLAVDYFVHRVAREAGALAAAMGGIDGLVLTAGIGERSPEIRGRVLQRLRWLGFELDPDANARHGPLISTPGSRRKAYVVPTDEELMIARHALRLLRGGG